MSDYYGYVSVDALMEFAHNHVNGMIDSNDIARFPKADVKDANEQQSLQEIFGIPLDRLRELAEAEREGRVVVLPCKIGSDVWIILPDYTECSEYGVKYSESSCAGCEIACDSKPTNTISRARNVGLISIGGWIQSGCFGKTVFINREEAERALAATEPKGDAT